MNRLSSIIISGLTALALLTSCGSQKPSMTYFNNISATQSGQLGNVDYELRIVPDDELDISVTSINPAATLIYNLPTGYTQTIDPTTHLPTYTPTADTRAYLVSASGDINFPVLGKLHVAGMTTTQLAEMIEKRIAPEVEEPIVTVKLRNFKVSVLGEVGRPGVVQASGERFSILDAIARSGDLNQYAVRDNVLLIREVNGKKEYHHLNLEDSEVFSSPYFYLQQNDMIIVEPNDVRRSNATYNVNNAYRIQVTSAIISACSVIASLVIALAIK